MTRDPDDNYETPAWCVRSIWPHVRPISGQILDPCAGRGAILEALVDLWPANYLHARELNPERFETLPLGNFTNKLHCDWLHHDELLTPRVILTNPPYRLVLEFCQKALEVVQLQGTVAMLLRLNFLGSQKRHDWLRDHIPDVYVLSRRPSFTPDGKTDSCEYAWFVWGSDRFHRGHGRIHMLEERA